jgi:hypothetical protein
MSRAKLARTDLRACPEDVDGRIQRAAQVLEIAHRANAEEPVERGVVAVIGRADEEGTRGGPRADPMQDIGLDGGRLGKIPAHVVEQDGQARDTQRVQVGELVGQGGPGLGVEPPVELERAEPDPELDAGLATEGAEGGQRLGLIRRMRLTPAPPQIHVRLGRIDEEAVAPGGQELCDEGALVPGPGPAVVTFDDAERRRSVHAHLYFRPIRRAIARTRGSPRIGSR